MKTCPECKGKVVGRSDKIFCSGECRVNYHNSRNKDENKLMRNINRILRKNRRVLLELNNSGKSGIKREILLEKGFNFNYFTNRLVADNGDIFFYCYEQSYHLRDDSICISVHQNTFNGI